MRVRTDVLEDYSKTPRKENLIMEVKENTEKQKDKAYYVFRWTDLFNPNKPVPIKAAWHNLPKDILVEVMRRVSPYEQFCIRAACRNWWAPHPEYKLLAVGNKLPWMMTWYESCQPYLRLRPQFCLHHPTHDKRTPYRIDKMIGCPVPRYDILAIKHGWVLYHKRSGQAVISHLFMFSPFTERMVKLPDLYFYWTTVATFSSGPSSSNCVFLASIVGHEISINICRPHDTSWTNITKRCFFNETLVGVVCIWPFFYLVTGSGTIVKCDVHGHCKFLVRLPMYLKRFERCDHHVLQHRGEVLLVCLDTAGGEEDQCHVFRFIWSNNVWVPQTRIGKRAIFISITSFLVSEFGAMKNMAERVYYLDKKGFLKFFCLKDGKSYVCEAEEGFECRGWLADNGKSRFFIEQP